MSMFTTLLYGEQPEMRGKITVFRPEEYRDKTVKKAKLAKKVRTNQDHNMVVTERLNRAKVLKAIRRKPDSSAGLVERTKLCRTSIYNLTKALIEEGKIVLRTDVYPRRYEASHVSQ